MGPKKIIHIGLCKTATTSLQALLFKTKNIYFLGRHISDYKNDELKYIVWVELLESDAITFDIESVKNIISKHYEMAINQKRKAFILSEESITAPWWSNVSFNERLQRLQYVFGRDSNIVLTLREQTSFVKSMYKELLKIGLDCTYETFIQFIILRNNKFLMPFLNYEKLIEICKSYFDNVQVYFYEDIINNIESQHQYLNFFKIPESSILPHKNSSQKISNDDYLNYNKLFPYMMASGFKGFTLCDFFRRTYLNLNTPLWNKINEYAQINYNRHFDIMEKSFQNNSNCNNLDQFSIKKKIEDTFNLIVSGWNRSLANKYCISLSNLGYKV